MQVTPILTSNTSNQNAIADANYDNNNAFVLFDNNNSTAWTVPSIIPLPYAASAFTFWRIDNIIPATVSTLNMTQLQLGDSTQTAITTGTVTFNRTTDSQSNAMSRLVDNNFATNTFLHNHLVYPLTIQWQFASPTEVRYIRQAGVASTSIVSCRLQASSDGITWYTVFDGALVTTGMTATAYSAWTDCNTSVFATLFLPAPVNAVDSYIIRCPDVVNYPPVAFTIQGLVTNTFTWVTLDTRSDLTTGWTNDSPRIFTFTSNFRSYSGFRIRLTSLPNSGISISEFSMLRTDIVGDSITAVGDTKDGVNTPNYQNPKIEGLIQANYAATIPIPDTGGGTVTPTRPVQGQLHPRGLR